MNKTTKSISVMVALLVAVGLVWYQVGQMHNLPKAGALPGTIQIGHITPLTGDAAVYGEWEKDGTELALEQLNQKGGINGQPIKIMREDDQADPTKSVTALNKLISVDKVQAVVGAVSSGATLADAPIAEQNKVVLLSGGAAAIKVTNAGDYIFRIFPTNAQEGEKLLAIANQLGDKNAAIIYINNDFGSDLAKVIREGAPALGINILTSESYLADAADFRTQLAKIKEKNPDAIFLLGHPKDMGIVLKQAQELGVKSQFFAPDSFDDPSIVAMAGKGAEGVIYVLPSDEASVSFKADFKNKYNKESNMMNALSYDAFNLLALAIERGGNNGTSIKDELYRIKDYAGASGNITFDANGDAVNRPLMLKTIKDGKAVLYQQ